MQCWPDDKEPPKRPRPDALDVTLFVFGIVMFAVFVAHVVIGAMR